MLCDPSPMSVMTPGVSESEESGSEQSGSTQCVGDPQRGHTHVDTRYKLGELMQCIDWFA